MTITPLGAAKTRACKKCGVIFSGVRCKECLKARQRDYVKRNPEKIKAARARFYLLNPEKVSAYNSAWRAKNPERFEAIGKKWRAEHKEIVSARSARTRAGLTDGYVASLLGMRADQAPKELIELKRVYVQIKRKIKESI